MGIGFKKRKVESNKLEKTLTILDSETNEVKEIIDIVDEVKEISLEDKAIDAKYSESQIKDMTFMQSLRDAYPDMKDMETFLTDSCEKAKPKILSDEEIAAEKEAVDKLAKAEGKAAKVLADAALKAKDDEKVRQIEIEEAERVKHETAQGK
jgi:hypothetical protein